mmetsp:Transcript_39624/g.84392  ORF Transcript_39624/g.84392 Transcript_39624/m.84392 type:complete len:202 (-) Transcript_39624:328-933(-)
MTGGSSPSFMSSSEMARIGLGSVGCSSRRAASTSALTVLARYCWSACCQPEASSELSHAALSVEPSRPASCISRSATDSARAYSCSRRRLSESCKYANASRETSKVTSGGAERALQVSATHIIASSDEGKVRIASCISLQSCTLFTLGAELSASLVTSLASSLSEGTPCPASSAPASCTSARCLAYPPRVLESSPALPCGS